MKREFSFKRLKKANSKKDPIHNPNNTKAKLLPTKSVLMTEDGFSYILDKIFAFLVPSWVFNSTNSLFAVMNAISIPEKNPEKIRLTSTRIRNKIMIE